MVQPVTTGEVLLQQIVERLDRVIDLLEGGTPAAQPAPDTDVAPENMPADIPAAKRTRTRTRRTTNAEGGPS